MAGELTLPGVIVEASWLADNITHEKLKVLDASYKIVDGQLGKESFLKRRIPDARYFDLEGDFSKRGSELPHMLPNEREFSAAASDLGISNDDVLVIYDDQGVFSAPRAWWMFKTMGHDNVAVLNGGLDAWKNLGFSLDSGPNSSYETSDFQAEFNPAFYADQQEVIEALEQGAPVIDARSRGRFKGEDPEPRHGMPSGHMPGSANLPFAEILHNGRYQDPSVIADAIAKVNPVGLPMIFSCGSGVTACILALGAEIVGWQNYKVFDGSWCQWCDSASPIAVSDKS